METAIVATSLAAREVIQVPRPMPSNLGPRPTTEDARPSTPLPGPPRFDYRQTATVYEARGVTIKSFPALHIYDGPVSYRLEWNGFSFAFSGDTTPSQFFVDNAKNCDLVVHDTFNTVSQLLDRFGDDEKAAKGLGTIAHSAPKEAGYVLDLVRPRLAILFHFFSDFGITPN